MHDLLQIRYTKKNKIQFRPFLIQSDSASRKRPFSTRLFLDWILLVLLLIVSRVDFIVFCAFLRGDWCEAVLLYSRRNRLAALCFALSPRATARRTFIPASWWLWAQAKAAKATFVELHSAENRRSYSRQPLLAAWDRDRALLASGTRNAPR